MAGGPNVGGLSEKSHGSSHDSGKTVGGTVSGGSGGSFGKAGNAGWNKTKSSFGKKS